MDTLLLEKNKHYIFKDIIYSDFLDYVSYVQKDIPLKLNNVLIIIPNCDKLAMILVACILLNKKIYYIDPLKPQNIKYIKNFEILYTTKHFYNNNKKNIDKLCKNIHIIDNIKQKKQNGKIQNIYTKLDINIVNNNKIINVDYGIIKSQFTIFQKKLLKKKYIFMYNLMDIDILPIFIYSILYKKTILFYKNIGKGINKKNYYIIRDQDDLNNKKKIVLYQKSQRIINNQSKNYLIFDSTKYLDIKYGDNKFIYNKYLKGFIEKDGCWIKDINIPINRELSYLENYYIVNPIYITKKFNHQYYNKIIHILYQMPFISLKYEDNYLKSINPKEIINPHNLSEEIYPFYIVINKKEIIVFGNIYYNSIFNYFTGLIQKNDTKYLIYKLKSKKNNIVSCLLVIIIWFITKLSNKKNEIDQYSVITKEIELDINDDPDSVFLNKININRDNLTGFYLLKYNYCLFPKNSDDINEIIYMDDFYKWVTYFNINNIIDNLFIGIFYIGDNTDFDFNIINTHYRMVIIISIFEKKCYFKFYYRPSDKYFVDNFN